VHLVGFILRIYHDALSSECQTYDVFDRLQETEGMYFPSIIQSSIWPNYDKKSTDTIAIPSVFNLSFPQQTASMFRSISE